MLKIKKKKAKSKNSAGLLFKNLGRVLKLYWFIDKKGAIVFVTTVAILSTVPFVSSYLWGQSLNEVVKFLNGQGGDTNLIYTLFGISIGIGIVEALIWQLNDYNNRMTWFKWHEYMSIEVPRKISSLDTEKFENPTFKNLINKVENGYSHKPGNFIENFVWSLYQFIQVISAIVIVSTFNFWLLPIIIVSLVPSLIVQLKGSRLGWGIWDSKGEDSRKYSRSSWYLRNDRYVQEIKIYGLGDYLLNTVRQLLRNFQNEQIKVQKRTQWRVFASSLLEMGVEAGIQFWMLMRVLTPNSGFGIGDFTFMRSSIERFTSGTRNFFKNFNRLYEDNLFMTDLFKLLDTNNEIISKFGSTEISKNKVPKIEFKNVSFSYPGVKKKVFENLNITINPGEDIALVGENGAGKTTFVKLLLRFYDVTEGKILINDVDIRDIDLKTYYENIGVLFQDFNKYYFPVKENISVGDTSITENIALVETSAEQAGAAKFVNEYKRKYKQVLHKEFKNGIEPSGGQWQRIALARAFYRNANILILDEPTSAIDAKGEYEIFKAIEKVQTEKTTIIISHRFSTVRNADKIYVIEHGKIIESGAHEDLMKIKSGKYKEMFEVQAEGYK